MSSASPERKVSTLCSASPSSSVSGDRAVDTGALLSAPATFTILREGAPDAVFSGYPARVEQGGHFNGYAYYTVELRPAFWKLTQVVQSAIFLNQTAEEVTHSLLSRSGILASFLTNSG